MSTSNEYELWRQRSREMLREAEMARLARAGHTRRPRWASALRRAFFRLVPARPPVPRRRSRCRPS